MDNARTAVEQAQKDAKAGADSTRPGAIDLTVTNVLDTDHGYDVLVDGESRKTAVTSQTCAVMNVAPGLHELAVTAVLSGGPAHVSQSVTVTPGTATKLSVTLTKAKAAGAQ